MLAPAFGAPRPDHRRGGGALRDLLHRVRAIPSLELTGEWSEGWAHVSEAESRTIEWRAALLGMDACV